MISQEEYILNSNSWILWQNDLISKTLDDYFAQVFNRNFSWYNFRHERQTNPSWSIIIKKKKFCEAKKMSKMENLTLVLLALSFIIRRGKCYFFVCVSHKIVCLNTWRGEILKSFANKIFINLSVPRRVYEKPKKIPVVKFSNAPLEIFPNIFNSRTVIKSDI